MTPTKLDTIFQKSIYFLFNLLLVTTPLLFTWVNEELFEFNKMIATYVFTIIILGLWLSRMALHQKVLIKKTYLDFPIAIFLLSQIVSTVLSMYPYTSIFGYYGRFHGGLLSTFSYVTLYYAFVSNFEKKHLPGIFLSAFLGGMLSALYAIPEHFGHSPSCLMITKWQNFDVSCWVQDVQNRVFGTFGQPNWLAAYAVTLIPLGTGLFLQESHNAQRITRNAKQLFYLTTVLLLYLVLLFTKSRSGILALAVGLAVFAIGWLITIYKNNSNKSLTPASPAGGLYTLHSTLPKTTLLTFSFLLLTIIYGTPFTPSLNQLINKNNQQTENLTAQNTPTSPVGGLLIANRLDIGGTDSGEIRKIVWQGAINIWKRYPVFGSGVETFAYSYYQDRPMAHNLVSEWDFLYNKAHNEFLNFLATTGIVGLGAYLILLGWFGIQSTIQVIKPSSHKAIKESTNNQQLITIGLLSGVIALSVSNFFGFSTVMVAILMFLYFAILELLKENESTAYSLLPTASKEIPYFLLSTILLPTAYLLFVIANIWQADKLYATGSSLADQSALVESAQTLEKAISKMPSEALYYEKLSGVYAQIVLALTENQATLSSQLTTQAISTSDISIIKNPVHLNFYKSRARMFIILAAKDPQYLTPALETLQTAEKLAPTDPKIVYNQGLILVEMGQTEQGIQTIQKALEMKPNYASARSKLAEILTSQGKIDAAIEQYQYILDYISPGDEYVETKIQELRSE